MKIDQEFSKYANHYGTYNVIQQKVATKVLLHVTGRPKRILDLGCGRGALASKIDWEYEKFVGVDFAPGMLELHPKASNIECIYGNFNDSQLYEHLFMHEFDYLLSASALQWAEDIEKVFQKIQHFQTPISLGIFTSNTFKTLYDTASLDPILRSKEELYALQKKYFDVQFEVVTYRLEFENKKDIFTYIKKSGVSGSRNVLSYKQTKQLMKDYPLNYLEFEVVFIYS